MGILKHFNFKAANETIKAAQRDVAKPKHRKDEVADRRAKKQGGKK